MNQIKDEVEEQEYLTWFNLDFQGANETAWTIAVPSAFALEQVKKRYQAYIESKIERFTGKKATLFFEVKPNAVDISGLVSKTDSTGASTHGIKSQPKAEEGKSGGKTPIPAGVQPGKPKKSPHPQLLTRYTFDNYITGGSRDSVNKFALNCAMAIANNPGKIYNPYLIFGGTGLGKTHLMMAIGNYIYENSDYKVIYTTAENFTNEFITMIGLTREKYQQGTDFREKYRKIDVLLIDDIHFLEGKIGTQEELFYIFDELFKAEKHLVFTCDRPVQELKKFNERLISRVNHGINVELQLPDYETRCAILKKKSEAMRLNLPNDVVDLISKNILTNVRDLESALTTLSAYAELVGTPITVETAQDKLKNLLFVSRPSNVSMEIIQRVIADSYNLSLNDLKGKKRNQSVVYPRQIAMYIIREITEYTTTDIGQAFGGRDHTTVMHSCQKIEEKMKTDPSMEPTIQRLIREIKEHSVKI